MVMILAICRNIWSPCSTLQPLDHVTMFNIDQCLHVSGLLKLTTVNSTTYGLISLIVGGAALAIAFGYLLTVAPAAESQFQSQYRAFTEGKLIKKNFGRK